MKVPVVPSEITGIVSATGTVQPAQEGDPHCILYLAVPILRAIGRKPYSELPLFTPTSDATIIS